MNTKLTSAVSFSCFVSSVTLAVIFRATQHPLRLLVFFCSIMFIVWFDNGLFASNGVTGCSKDCEDPVGFPTAQVGRNQCLHKIILPKAMRMTSKCMQLSKLAGLMKWVNNVWRIGAHMRQFDYALVGRLWSEQVSAGSVGSYIYGRIDGCICHPYSIDSQGLTISLNWCAAILLCFD